MPYGVKKQGNGWVKYKKDTGKIVSHHDTKEKAQASIKAYYANKNENIIPNKELKIGTRVQDLLSDKPEKNIGSIENIDKNSKQYFVRFDNGRYEKRKYDEVQPITNNSNVSFYKALMTEQLKQNPITLKSYGNEEQVIIKDGKYGNGATAITLISVSDGQPYATISVNITGESEKLPKNEFYVKDYSENEDIVRQLIQQQILIPTGKSVQTGFVTVKSYKLASYDSMNEVQGVAQTTSKNGVTISMPGDKKSAEEFNKLTKPDKQVKYIDTAIKSSTGTKQFSVSIKTPSGNKILNIDAKNDKDAEDAVKDVVKNPNDVSTVEKGTIIKEQKLRKLIRKKILKEMNNSNLENIEDDFTSLQYEINAECEYEDSDIRLDKGEYSIWLRKSGNNIFSLEADYFPSKYRKYFKEFETKYPVVKEYVKWV